MSVDIAGLSKRFGRAEILFTEHQHRVLSESLLDPRKGLGVERLGQIDAERFGAERFPERAKFACGHRHFLR